MVSASAFSCCLAADGWLDTGVAETLRVTNRDVLGAAVTVMDPNGSSTAKAIDYSLRCSTAFVHYIDDGQAPIDNNWIENRIRPIATGRKNWLFAGSLRAGKRVAAIMSLIQSAKLNGTIPSSI